MSNGSPTAYLLWAILSCIFFAFLCLHLWAYDRFKCLKWNSGRQPGAFKRAMTYSYLATLPLLVIFSVAMTIIKFKEGYIATTDGQIIPRPFSLWNPKNRHWLVPLYFVLSFAWALELVTHLEELAFWLFLLHQGPGKREWFHSWEFRTWYLGSMIAILGMPLTTLVTRNDLELCQAWIFMVGSLAGTSTTICFLYVLARFPAFIDHVKLEGAEPDVVIRLATFYQLNRIRVIFRFLFTVPLLLIAVDAIHGLHPVVSDPFALDFLLMMGGIGCFISSAITLLIFFPRSITRESGYQAKVNSRQNSSGPPNASTPLPIYYQQDAIHSPKSVDNQVDSPAGARMSYFRFPEDIPSPGLLQVLEPQSQPSHRRDSVESAASPGYETDAESIAMDSQPGGQRSRPALSPTVGGSQHAMSGTRSDDTVWEHSPDLSKRRRHSGGHFLYDRNGKTAALQPQEGGGSHEAVDRDAPPSQLHPYVMNFTSPIDLLDAPFEDDFRNV